MMELWSNSKLEEIRNKSKICAENFDKSTTIAEIHITNLTYAIIGGYDTMTYSKNLGISEVPRTTNIKGVWRWWTRAALAGAITCARGINNIDWNSVERVVKEKVKDLLGSTARSSKLAIELDVNVKDDGLVPFKKLEKVPRIHLLSQPTKQEIEEMKRVTGITDKRTLKNMVKAEKLKLLKAYEPEALDIVLKVRAITLDLEKSEKEFLLRTLLLSLLFSGIGAITRRGFGSLTFKSVKSRFIPSHVINEIYGTKSTKDLENTILRFIKDTISKALEILKLEVSSNCDLEGVPNYPILTLPVTEQMSPEKPYPTRLKVIQIESDDVDILKIIGESTLKNVWKRIIRRKVSDHGKDLHTWVLGLPRDAAKRTGYLMRTDDSLKEARRASSIIIRPITKRDKQWYITILGFLSRDWPVKQLVHKSATSTRKVLDLPITSPIKSKIRSSKDVDNFVTSVFNSAFEFIIKSLKLYGGI